METAPEAPSFYDVAFGVKLTNDYILRSVSQSNGKPAVQGYAELTLFDWVYAGIWGSNVDFGASNPSMELDFWGGLRHSFGPLTLDVGYIDVNYTSELKNAHKMDFWKIYGIAKYALTDWLTVGANIYWTSDFVGFGVDGTHSAAFARIDLPGLSTLPDVKFYVSGEFGRQWVAKNFAPDHNFWNLGGGATYKAMTLDLRYTGASLSKRECALFIGDRNSCGDRFMASLSFDTSLSKLK